MASQIFASSHTCPRHSLPLKHFQRTGNAPRFSRSGARRQHAAFTCQQRKQSQALTKSPPVSNDNASPEVSDRHSVLHFWLQAPSHPEFFPEQASEIKEQAALDVMARMQRSTVSAPSLTCPVATAYLGPVGILTKLVVWLPALVTTTPCLNLILLIIPYNFIFDNPACIQCVNRQEHKCGTAFWRSPMRKPSVCPLHFGCCCCCMPQYCLLTSESHHHLHAEYGAQHKDQAPVLLLHGFDSSSLEFRRLLPLLEEKLETWAVDLVGWGFTDSGAASQSNMKLGPKQKRDHLYAFWKEKVQPASCP